MNIDRIVITTLAILVVVWILLGTVTVKAAGYTCGKLESGMSFMPQYVERETRKNLKERGYGPCVVERADWYLRMMRRHCRAGKPIAEAERRSIELVTKICNRKREEN